MRAARKDGNHKSITDTIAYLRDKHLMPIHFVDMHRNHEGGGDFLLFAFFNEEDTEDLNSNELFCISSGITIPIEVKKPKQKLTKKQQEKAKKNRLGGLYVCRNFDDVLKALERYATLDTQWQKQFNTIKTVYNRET